MFKWDVTRVAAVINAQASEGQSLEFKSELPRSNDRGKAAQGIGGSAIIQSGITRLNGYKLALSEDGFNRTVGSSLNELQLPELLIEDLTQDLDLHVLMKPGFDLIWQAYGQPKCQNYRPDGVWEVK